MSLWRRYLEWRDKRLLAQIDRIEGRLKELERTRRARASIAAANDAVNDARADRAAANERAVKVPATYDEWNAALVERDAKTGLTTDPTDPRLVRGQDTEPVPQADAYLVLSDEEIAKGFVRPVRRSYVHITCGTSTTMGQKIAETYARDPTFYGGTYCVHCSRHLPVGEHGEFIWDDGSGQKVGT